MVVKNNAEFGIELALSVPYAYWLHKQDQLETVITSKGMKPFYYFCDDVREEYNHRTIDNKAAGLDELPNNWIHGDNGKGVLDYSKWICPPYKEYFSNNEFLFKNKTVFIINKYNWEHDHIPYGYFDIQCLYNIFNILTSKGYTVIYKRCDNKSPSITFDQNEQKSLISGYTDIRANVEGIGTITDKELTQYYDDVILFDDLLKTSNYSYNETQLKVMANCTHYISVCGGNGILSSLFGGNTILYIHTGKELRPGYFGKDSYFQKLSDNKLTPIFDVIHNIKDNYTPEPYEHKVNITGKNDYSELLETIKLL